MEAIYTLQQTEGKKTQPYTF